MVFLLLAIRLAQLILKRKFPSVDKPLQKKAPLKGPLKNVSPGAYFRNFTVFYHLKFNRFSNFCSSFSLKVLGLDGFVQPQ